MPRSARSRKWKAMITAAGCSAGLVVMSAPVASAATPVSAHPAVQHLCSDAQPGYRECFALRVAPSGPTADATPNATPSGYGPSDLASAYAIPSGLGSGKTVAIVDAYNDPTAASDLASYRSTYGLPACTVANGCFKQVSQTGSTTSLPTTDTGWAGEEALDIDMVSAGCPLCKIVLVEASSATNANLDAAVNYAATLSPAAISNSYGGSETSTDTSDSAYNHPGIAITASSGDEGYVTEFPAASPDVVAVGGTALTKTTSTSRGWTEKVWNTSNSEGAGSGCSKYETKPSWQADTGCTKRTVADVSAVADPATGVAVYDTTGGSGWAVYGGTSVSSPLVASLFAQAGNTSSLNYPAQYAYQNTASFNDVTTGQTSSSCSSYLCKAQAGYDGPTGIGTPEGLVGVGGSSGTASTFSVAVSPTSGSVVAGSSTSATVSTATTAGSAQTVALSVTGAPSGVTASLSPTSVTSGSTSTLTIATTSAAAAGTSTLTVTGTAGGTSHTATYSLTVTKTAPANDFSVAVSPTSGSVAAGSSATASVSTATTAGSAQTVALKVTGAPTGVTATLSPTSVTSGSGSTLSIATTSSAAAGTYTLTVTGTATSGSHTATYALTVTAVSACSSPGQKIANPGFESGATSWTQTSGVINTDGTYARTGSGYAWLDGYGTSHTDTLSQSLTIPAGCKTYTLSFYTMINTSETTTTSAYDKLTVTLGSTTLGTFSNLNASSSYVLHTYTVSGLAGTTSTLKFSGVEDSSLQTSFFIDDTALNVS